ncbi:Uncharacterized protein SCF082_LOCUS28056, partial [Durusdinium trenchii]
DFDNIFEVEPPASVERPLAQKYDFIEVCGGNGVISAALAELGYVVDPIIDINCSHHYDMTKLRTLEWLIFLIKEDRYDLATG